MTIAFPRLQLMTFSKTQGTNMKRTYRNKITEMKINTCSLSNLTRNAFVLYFFTKKRMEEWRGTRKKKYSL